MAVVQDGIGHDLDHCYGACHSKIAAYGPGYEKGGETACHPPGQGFRDTTGSAIIQSPSLFGFLLLKSSGYYRQTLPAQSYTPHLARK